MAMLVRAATRKPSDYWKNPDNCKKFIEDASKKLRIKSNDDWYKITENVRDLVFPLSG
jgi:hypothetical protein